MADYLIYEQDGPLVTLTMNQPEQRNPLTGNTAVPEFLAAVDRIHDDRRVRCVILTGNGPSFCAGGDIRAIRQNTLDGRHALSAQFFATEYRVNALLADYPHPVVSLIDGICMGGGLGLSVHGPFRVVTESATLASHCHHHAGQVQRPPDRCEVRDVNCPRLLGLKPQHRHDLAAVTPDADPRAAWRRVDAADHAWMRPVAVAESRGEVGGGLGVQRRQRHGIGVDCVRESEIHWC